MINKFKDHADGIVLFGMSCSGKTTFANAITSHRYFCFDAIFHWHEIETLGLSTSEGLKTVTETVETSGERWIVDGWHLADANCRCVPCESSVYVIYAHYDQIINQYRVPVGSADEHLGMYRKWYSPANFAGLYGLRYFFNDGSSFIETDTDEFYRVTSQR